MTTAVLVVGVFVGMLLGGDKVARLIFDTLSDEQRERLRSYLSGPAERVARQDALQFALAPLRLIAWFFDGLLGPALLSKRAVKRGAALTGILMVVALFLAGSSDGSPWYLNAPPWRAVPANIERGERFLRGSKELKHTHPVDPSLGDIKEQEEAYQAMESVDPIVEKGLAVFRQFDTPLGRGIYGFLLSGVVAATIVVVGTFSISLTRRQLRNMFTASNLTLLIGALMINAVLGVSIAAITFVLVLFLSLPVLLASYSPAFFLASEVPLIGVPFAAFVLMLPVFFAQTSWIKALTLAIALPSLLLLAGGLSSAVLYPVRRPLHAAIAWMLRRAADSDSAFRVFATLAAVVLVLVAKGVFSFF